ncbi:MAG TPA: c-type cytochrome [Gemmatimonadales bacterium]|nr:c-type cytochrome [Gemmatimonadales bacterium]
MRRLPSAGVAVLLVLAGCAVERREPPHQAAIAGAEDTLPLPTRRDTIAPPDSPLGASIRRGYALLHATRDSLPDHVGNDLRCVSCHLDGGTRANAMPWVGVVGRFPQYNARAGRVITIADRVNGCFRRSLNGRALAADSPEMRDIVAYFQWLSAGVPNGAVLAGQGLPKPTALVGDSSAGRIAYASTCARCHGEQGAGTHLGPPLWGPRSFNLGAGITRIRTMAGFLRHNMPYDAPGTLTEQQALDIAAYVTAQPRPDFPDKVHDWPHGDPPPDLNYPTAAGRRDTR